MTDIDSLVFDLEVKAAVLRAVSHLEPDEACHLLLRLVCDIRQSRARPRPRREPVLVIAPEEVAALEQDEEQAPETPRAPEEVAAPGPLAAPPAPQSGSRPNRAQTIRNVLRARGPLRRSSLLVAVSKEMGEKHTKQNHNKTRSVLGWLLMKNYVLQDQTENYDNQVYLPSLSSGSAEAPSSATATSSAG